MSSLLWQIAIMAVCIWGILPQGLPPGGLNSLLSDGFNGSFPDGGPVDLSGLVENFFAGTGVIEGNYTQLHPESLKVMEEMCRTLSDQLNQLIEQNNVEKSEVPKLPEVCDPDFKMPFKNMAADQAFHWLSSLQNDAPNLNRLLNKRTGLQDEELVPLINNMKYDMQKSGLLQRLTGEHVHRLGGWKKLTVEKIAELGPAFVYAVPENSIRRLPRPVMDYILDMIHDETMKSLGPVGEDMFVGGGQAPMIDHRAAIYGLLPDETRMRSICSRAFGQYKTINTEDAWNKTMFLLVCASARTCSRVDADLLKRDLQYVGSLPFLCSPDMTMMWNPQTYRTVESLQNKICVRRLMNKVTAGSNAINYSNPESFGRLQNLMMCSSVEHLTEASRTIPCEETKELPPGIPSKVAEAVYDRCLAIPSDPSSVTCEELSKLGPVLRKLKRPFWLQIPEAVLCQGMCLDFFRNQTDISDNLKSFIMRKCFSQRTGALSSEEVRNLGGMVTSLPMDQLKDIQAADLIPSLQEVKKSLRANRRQKAKAKRLAKKMLTSGNIQEMTDSKEMMRQISLKDLAASITDVEADLGLNDTSKQISLTSSQKRWVLRKIMRKKPQLTAAEIRAKGSLVLGFSVRNIRDLMKGSETGIALASALCEQTNWPVKTGKTINRLLIKQNLEDRNGTEPMQQLTDLDVQSLGCECLLHFSKDELLGMQPEVCAATCRKIGYCDNFRCLNPYHRRSILDACLTCEGVDLRTMTSDDWVSLGYTLISQLSAEQLAQVPASVVETRQGDFKEMCLDKSFRAAVVQKMLEAYGSDTSAYNEDTLTMLSSNIQLFTESQQNQMDKALIFNMAEQISTEMELTETFKECCERWFSADDKASVEEQRHQLMVTLKNAIMQSLSSARRRRAVAQWTCQYVTILKEGFTTVSIEEINAMDNTEFSSCLADIGALTEWTSEHKDALLVKAEASVADVCSMTENDLTSLGYISQAMTVADINCITLESDVLASFGELPLSGWSQEQVSAIIQKYEQSAGLTSLSSLVSSDIAELGNLLCGFETFKLSTLQSQVIAESGTQIGTLSDCSLAHMEKLKILAVDPAAYGPVANWTSAELGELGYLIIGLTGEELLSLDIEALEGLTADVISNIPAEELKMMSLTQLRTFTDIQAGAVTPTQRAAMSPLQRSLLTDLATDGYGMATDNNEETEEGGAAGLRTGVLMLTALIPILFLPLLF